MEPQRIDGYGFAREIASQPGGRDILKCIQCGTCAGGCPVESIDRRYSPRRLIAQALLGLRSAVLASEMIWLCARCQTCVVNCPKGVRPGDVLGAMRRIAITAGAKGPGPRHARALYDNVARSGLMNPVSMAVKTVGLAGTIRMLPMGLKMLQRGKILSPLPKVIKGHDEVRRLYDLPRKEQE